MNVQMQLPNTLPYTALVMTCTVSLQFQTVMHTHLYQLAAKDINQEHSRRRGASTPRFRALSDVKAKLKTETCKSHKLGSAKADTGYYTYWKDLRPLVNMKPATNASWNNSNLRFVIYYEVLNWYNLSSKACLRYGFFPNVNCPMCHSVQTDIALHILFGCQHTKTRKVASALIVQALQKRPCVPTKLLTMT